ncbi:MAG TPA: phosphomannomutase/phosphoglucomutase [Solirubrobacteraceae bacterium]|nr:phosphomannomutase/phosphoglucomutase [Solirubrobacteraceae bacterium]
MGTRVDPGIFKAYDIRGLYGEQIDADLAEQIGRAFARVLGGLAGKAPGQLRVGMGHDMRLTAPELAARYCQGMVAEGVHVLDAGQVGSEVVYFLVGSRELDGGLMCTASHNPKAYTGVKLIREGALALSGDEGIQEIRAEVEAVQDGTGAAGAHDTGGGAAAAAAAAAAGSVEQVDLAGEYQQATMRFIDPNVVRRGKRLKVVVDGANGMAGPTVGPLLDELGLDLVKAYWTPDGNFPDHEPNPLLEENRRFIVEQVREQQADLGIAWDGDADRCFFIDDHGRFVPGDFLTALLAESLLRRHPGEAILYDVRASWAVPDTVTRAGGRAFINRVGHAFFKTRMRAEGSLFGGEVSGHYYFRDFYCADSGTLPALLVLELLAREGVPMSQLLEPYRSRYFISGEVNSRVDDPAAKIEEIAARYSDAKQGRLDGISIDYEDWHFNVRASNTEPLLRLCLESLVSPEDMERRRDEVLAVIRS